jgi:hypothetical protein
MDKDVMNHENKIFSELPKKYKRLPILANLF